MSQGGQTRFLPSDLVPVPSMRHTVYSCLRFQFGLLGDVIGPVL